jgi:hypothetical protein
MQSQVRKEFGINIPPKSIMTGLLIADGGLYLRKYYFPGTVKKSSRASQDFYSPPADNIYRILFAMAHKLPG